MPAIMEQVSRLSVSERLRLVEEIVKSISFSFEKPEPVAVVCKKRRSAHELIGYGRRFDPVYRSTDEIMRELREGEA